MSDSHKKKKNQKKNHLFNLVGAAHVHLLPKQGSPIEAPMPLKQIYSDWVPLAHSRFAQQVCGTAVLTSRPLCLQDHITLYVTSIKCKKCLF